MTGQPETAQINNADSAALHDIWYFIAPSQSLSCGAMQGMVVAGLPLLLARDRQGNAFILRDVCPHRAVPLSCGRFDGQQVECGYHGWRFDRNGTCVAIPSLVEGQSLDLIRLQTRSYVVAESQGCIWGWLGNAPPDHPPPALPVTGPPQLVESMVFGCAVDHAVIGLMDPAHGPFVHQGWWWRSRRSIRTKEKAFGPALLGFVMKRHPPSGNSRAYRLLGGQPETEIAFRLPGIRIEQVWAGSHHLCGLTAITPIDAGHSRITQIFWWSMPWLTLLRPVLRQLVRRFLDQDRRIIDLQQQGLRHDPPLLLIADADTQARWYHKLKREYRAARAEARPFVNPVPDTVLRWRS